MSDTRCGCPVNAFGDIRCHKCGEYVNVRCYNCGTRRGAWDCPNPLTDEVRVTSEGGLPTDAAARKAVPIATGVLDYFPDAIAEVARVSKVGNDQHNPGQPLHWAKEKSSDEADALVRHLLERGKRDADGMRHTAKVAWRALALLQRELDAEREGVK